MVTEEDLKLMNREQLLEQLAKLEKGHRYWRWLMLFFSLGLLYLGWFMPNVEGWFSIEELTRSNSNSLLVVIGGIYLGNCFSQWSGSQELKTLRAMAKWIE